MDNFLEHSYLCHYGIKGMKWGVRRYQNLDGSLTNLGMLRYAKQKVNEQAARQFSTVGSGLNTIRSSSSKSNELFRSGFKGTIKSGNPIYRNVGRAGILALNAKREYEKKLSEVKNRTVNSKDDVMRKQIDSKDFEDRIKEFEKKISMVNTALKSANERTKHDTAVKNLQNKPASIQNNKSISERTRLIREAEENTPQKYSIARGIVKDISTSDFVEDPRHLLVPVGSRDVRKHVYKPLIEKTKWGVRKKKNKGR